MNKNDERTLKAIMQWRDDHVDERGVRQVMGGHLLRKMGLNARWLYEEGFMTYQGRKMIPTAKAEAWWIEEKRRMRGDTRSF